MSFLLLKTDRKKLNMSFIDQIIKENEKVRENVAAYAPQFKLILKSEIKKKVRKAAKEGNLQVKLEISQLKAYLSERVKDATLVANLHGKIDTTGYSEDVKDEILKHSVVDIPVLADYGWSISEWNSVMKSNSPFYDTFKEITFADANSGTVEAKQEDIKHAWHFYQNVASDADNYGFSASFMNNFTSDFKDICHELNLTEIKSDNDNYVTLSWWKPYMDYLNEHN